MATSTYFCTGCGEPQPEIGQFCTNCGMPIDTSTLGSVAVARPGATVRLPESAAVPAQADGAPTSTLPPTTVLPRPTQPRPSRRPRLALGRLNPRLLAIGAALVLVLVVGGVVLVRGLPFGRTRGIDRVVTLAQSRNGDITLVLMHSDGSNKVTLVDDSVGTNGAGHSLFVQHLSVNDDSRMFGTENSFESQGAVVLAKQQRIIFWYPTSDGMEIRSVDLDGGDMAKLAQASPATHLVISDTGDKILLVETEKNAGRLSVVDLHGQVTSLVQNALEVNGTVSPDGQHVAYWEQADQKGGYKLTVTDITGANPVEVARDLKQVSAEYSADASKLFITRSDDKGSTFLAANADGQNPVVLSRNGDSGSGQVANGRLIFAVNGPSGTSLFSSDLNGDDRVEIVRAAESLAWRLTPDHKRVIFTQTRNGRTSLQVSDLKHDQVQDLKRSDGSLLWEPLDGERVLVLRGVNGSNEYAISTMKLDGTDEQILKRDLTLSRLTVQSSDIVVGGQESGHGALYLLGGKESVALDDEADNYTQARVTPGGRVIYTAVFKSGPVTYIVDRTGKQRKLLAEDASIVATGF